MVRMPVYTDAEVRDPQIAACNTAHDNARLATGDTKCINDKCMMWRWAQPERRDANHEPVLDRQGYCGLAGVPAFLGGAAK